MYIYKYVYIFIYSVYAVYDYNKPLFYNETFFYLYSNISCNIFINEIRLHLNLHALIQLMHT